MTQYSMVIGCVWVTDVRVINQYHMQLRIAKQSGGGKYIQPSGKTLETRHPVRGPLSREFTAFVITAHL